MEATEQLSNESERVRRRNSDGPAHPHQEGLRPLAAGMLALQRRVGNRVLAGHFAAVDRASGMQRLPDGPDDNPMGTVLVADKRPGAQTLDGVKASVRAQARDAANMCDQSAFPVAGYVARAAAQATAAGLPYSPGLAGIGERLNGLAQACKVAETLDLQKIVDAAVGTRDAVRSFNAAVVAEMNAAMNQPAAQGTGSVSGPVSPGSAQTANLDALSDQAGKVLDHAEQAAATLATGGDPSMGVAYLRAAKMAAGSLPAMSGVAGQTVIAAARSVTTAANHAELAATTWVHKGKNLAGEFRSIATEVESMPYVAPQRPDGAGAETEAAPHLASPNE